MEARTRYHLVILTPFIIPNSYVIQKGVSIPQSMPAVLPLLYIVSYESTISSHKADLKLFLCR
jgi:hypothetical protein